MKEKTLGETAQRRQDLAFEVTGELSKQAMERLPAGWSFVLVAVPLDCDEGGPILRSGLREDGVFIVLENLIKCRKGMRPIDE